MRTRSAHCAFKWRHGDEHPCIGYFSLCLRVSDNASRKYVFKLLAPPRWEEAASRGTVKKGTTSDVKNAPVETKPSWFIMWVQAGVGPEIQATGLREGEG